MGVADAPAVVEALLLDDPAVEVSVVDVDELLLDEPAVDVGVDPVASLEVLPSSAPHPEQLGATSVMDRKRIDVMARTLTHQL